MVVGWGLDGWPEIQMKQVGSECPFPVLQNC